MKCNNKFYQIADGASKEGFAVAIILQTAAIVNNEEQSPKHIASMDGLVIRELVGNETGIGKVITDYEFDEGDGELTIERSNYPADTATFVIRGCVGNAHFDATLVVNLDGEDNVVRFPDYVVKYISDGEGGGEFKSDEYYDADGRVVVVRESDGSTTIYDEHENPIIKRLATGATQIFDAFQSVRFQIGPHGGMLVNVPDRNDITFGAHAAVNIGKNDAVNLGAFANGEECKAVGKFSHAEGYGTETGDTYAHAEGSNTNARDTGSHAEGEETNANGQHSHAEGYRTETGDTYAHAEGYGTVANGYGSHAEGEETIADANCSHVEGLSCRTNGEHSHAEGDHTTANGDFSHAEGSETSAGTAAHNSHAEGVGNQTTDDGQHAQGMYNFSEELEGVSGAFSHGCGTSDSDRKNAFIIKGSEIYVYGVGGYNGTNSNDPNVKSLRQVLHS